MICATVLLLQSRYLVIGIFCFHCIHGLDTERNCYAYISRIIRIKMIILKFTYMSPPNSKCVPLNLPIGLGKKIFRKYIVKFDVRYKGKHVCQHSGTIFRNSRCAITCAVLRLANTYACYCVSPP